MTELNSSRTVLVSTVTERCGIFAACHAAYLNIPLAEISYDSVVYNESYTQKNLGGPLIMAHRVLLSKVFGTSYSATDAEII